MKLSLTPRLLGTILLAFAAFGGFMAWDAGKNQEIDRKELDDALGRMQVAAAKAAAYNARNAVLQQQVDSLARLRAKRDTIYVAKRDSALVWLDPITGITPDSAAKLIPHIQNACRSALNACDEYRASAEEEKGALRAQIQNDSTEIRRLNVDLDSANARILDLVTQPEPEPTFGQKLKKAAQTTLVILAIIGAFFVGQGTN